MSDVTVIRPQEGFQMDFMSSQADIVIGGGAAGAGKTFALLVEFLRHHQVKGWGGVIFRRTGPQIKSEGGLWDTSVKIYPHVKAIPRESVMEWKFPKGPKLKFSHLEYEKNTMDWQGSQIPFIGFDELTHFTKSMFFYLLGRNRSVCGVKPYVRATCNPDPDSWVADFIKWFIDQETGYPIPERCGQLRYFIRQDDHYVWGSTRQEVIEQVPNIDVIAKTYHLPVNELVKSMTFIPGSIYQNKELLNVDPGYLANLLSQDEEIKAQLLEGNWKIRTDGLGLFDYYATNNLFSNQYAYSGTKCITCDASRFGRDFTVIMVWDGFKVIFTDVYYKTEAHDIVKAIEELRMKYRIPKSNCLVDQDGVGGGTVKLGGYRGFSGGAKAMKDPATRIMENYKNNKTQCAYRMAKRVNDGEAHIEVNSQTVRVNGILGTKVKVGKNVVDIAELIKADLKSFKRDKIDMDGKQCILPKEEQKIILGGRSPDFGDTFIMREWFELRTNEYIIGSESAMV